MIGEKISEALRHHDKYIFELSCWQKSIIEKCYYFYWTQSSMPKKFKNLKCFGKYELFCNITDSQYSPRVGIIRSYRNFRVRSYRFFAIRYNLIFISPLLILYDPVITLTPWSDPIRCSFKITSSRYDTIRSSFYINPSRYDTIFFQFRPPRYETIRSSFWFISSRYDAI